MCTRFHTCVVVLACVVGLVHTYDASEKAALKNLAAQTRSFAWKKSDFWTSDDCCQWFGIACDGSGRVVKIDLRNNNLDGQIPSGFVSNFPRLQELNLQNNKLLGVVSTAMLNHPSMKVLDLSHNQLFGSFPVITSTPPLLHIDLSTNRISGSLPPSVSNLRSIKILALTNNLLTGALPDISDLSTMQELWLASNRLTSLPTFSPSANLVVFNVANNSISGGFPETCYRFTSLVTLDLSFNQFSGSIMSASNPVKELKLASNRFSGEIPSSIQLLKGLRVIDFTNNALTGSVPMDIMELSALTTLKLSRNNLGGLLPQQLHLLKNLKVIALDSLRFLCPLPVLVSGLAPLVVCIDGECAAGTVRTPEGKCVSCLAGTYAEKDAPYCLPCPPGTFSSSNGAAKCSPCAINHQASGEGQTACDACTERFYANVTGAVTCKSCPTDFDEAESVRKGYNNELIAVYNGTESALQLYDSRADMNRCYHFYQFILPTPAPTKPPTPAPTPAPTRSPQPPTQPPVSVPVLYEVTLPEDTADQVDDRYNTRGPPRNDDVINRNVPVTVIRRPRPTVSTAALSRTDARLLWLSAALCVCLVSLYL